ncbi:ABC transporter permease [Actinomycetospora chiangmaiensis]|uniref:ABC transporter permease n=1 Tax=Actinomycetospora chiangmaiensis TaxID=402650 RepID=UPI00035DCDB3|nr:ABC transporter permease subunit [Actinomycetospora chiangmaiensis]
MTLVESPAATGPAAPPAVGPAPGRGGGALRLLGRRLLPVGASIVAVLVLWTAFLQVFGIRRVIGKTPLDVWGWLVTAPQAVANRGVVFGNLGITLRDAGIGYVAGLVAALAVAMVFVLSRSVEQALMPVATLLRSVPLVAMTPIIVLAFGRTLGAVAVIGAIVVFFPALVTLVYGLRSASVQAQELVAVYGGTRWTRLRLVMLPSAAPAFFAAARLGVPGALVGSLMAEWLATGEGIGAALLKAMGGFRYLEMWSSVAVVTAVSILAYALVGVVESVVLARMGLD